MYNYVRFDFHSPDPERLRIFVKEATKLFKLKKCEQDASRNFDCWQVPEKTFEAFSKYAGDQEINFAVIEDEFDWTKWHFGPTWEQVQKELEALGRKPRHQI
jgi:hypothetical protein